MNEKEISREDFDEWLTYPQTKAFFGAVKSEQETALQMIVKTVDMDSLTQARMIGILSGLQKVLELDYDDTK
jgi:hypothetical protein